ncbi:MAG: OmpA family protein [Balneolaceae bacterium]|nr:OmpA family protein [Balneolaceae bacterium]MDR9409456.1 OmpA family protein [Balneolaceae bacterium]
MKINKITLFLLFFAIGTVLMSCRTSEEVTEPEPEPTVTEETTDDDNDWMAEEPEEEEEVEIVEELNTINFGFDLYSITDQAARQLADNVTVLRDNPATRVRVDAYTDHVGGDQYNLRLSLRRAAAVVDFYRQNGIGEDRIESRGLGKAPVPCSQMEMDTDTPGCEKNRRAESHPINPTS